MALAATPRRQKKSTPRRQNTASQQRQLRQRVAQLAQVEMEFIYNDDFPLADPHEILDPAALLNESTQATWKPSADLPVHLVRMCERKLFTPDEERAYFRRMNYAKYRAELLRRELDPDHPDADVADQVEQMQALGISDREEIIRANLRLVISLAKKFSGGLVPFDELLSEGIETLLRAVEKFDYTRGFRFSTYATQAVRRTLYRYLQAAQRDRGRFVLADQNLFEECPAAETHSPTAERRFQLLRSRLVELLDKLDPRERSIIRLRFGLGEPDEIRTLQSLANEMGICKERVRQLEIRAVNKLREMAEKIELPSANEA